MSIPRYLYEGWLVPLSKNKGKDQAELKDIRPIVVRSYLAKILEKAIMAKVAALAPHLLQTRIYQTGFKEGTSTATHVSRLIHRSTLGEGRRGETLQPSSTSRRRTIPSTERNYRGSFLVGAKMRATRPWPSLSSRCTRSRGSSSATTPSPPT